MDFGGLDDILDDDMGYIPTAIKREEKPRGRPASISRQNSAKSIGSMKDAIEEETKNIPNNRKPEDSLFGFMKQSPRNSSFNMDPQPIRQSSRRNTLFGIHKETAQQVNHSQAPTCFEDFFKGQNTSNNNSNNLSKPLILESRPPLPQRKLEKNSSFSQLSSPQNIIDDQLNNSSVASRRGRPPMSRRGPNTNNIEVQIPQNKSQNFDSSKGFSKTNQTNVDKQHFHDNISIGIRQQNLSIPNPQPILTSNTISIPVVNNTFMNQSMQELKNIFSNQLQYQKQAFETLIKQERQSHTLQIQKIKEFHQQEMKKKIQIKEFQIQKLKQFYELQLRIHNQRQHEVKEYNSIAKKLQGNIQIIQKLEKNMKQNQIKDRTQKEDHKHQIIQRKQIELKLKQSQLKSLQSQLEQQLHELRNQKIQLNQQINLQKSRLYELQLQLRKKESQLQLKHKKLDSRLVEEYETKAKQLEIQREQLRMQSLQVQQQRNLIEVEKLQVINSRKLWDNEKKSYLELLHQQKTKVLQKEIQLASRSGQVEIKQQQIQMNQNDYLNKLKLVELQKKKIEIEKKNSKGQLYFNSTSMTPLGIKTNGFLGTTTLNKTSQSALNKEFYSNEEYQNQPFEEQKNYKKSITQMRDQFLKSLPKF